MNAFRTFGSLVFDPLCGLIVHSLNGLNRLTGKKISYRFYLKVLKNIDVIHTVDLGFAKVKFDASDLRPASRFASIFEKEPDVIAWLDEFLEDGDALYDVGANVGIFSIYAALKKNVKVIAFEPESNNYFLLNKNIYLNGLDQKITALNVALNDANTISTLNLREFTPGGSAHAFDATINTRHEEFKPSFKQSVVGYSLDSLLEEHDLPFPTMVKIDVDGNEHRILAGMKKTLRDSRLKTIVIEATPALKTYQQNIDAIESAGFKMLTAKKYVNQPYLDAGIQNLFFARG